MQLLVLDFKYLNYKFTKPWETLFAIFFYGKIPWNCGYLKLEEQ